VIDACLIVVVSQQDRNNDDSREKHSFGERFIWRLLLYSIYEQKDKHHEQHKGKAIQKIENCSRRIKEPETYSISVDGHDFMP
jgi:hypothetical protein